MDRRGFFRSIKSSILDVAPKAPPLRIAKRIRPPFALPDPHFTWTCTRCDLCIAACPYQVLERLPDNPAFLDRGTPVMNLERHGCHLCTDWPCVAACEPKALALPAPLPDASPNLAPPLLATARLDTTRCLPWSGPECGACQGSCPIVGALIWDRSRPTITLACIGCGLCHDACIVEPNAIIITVRENDDAA